jgi:hypothetical protein
MAGQAAQPLIDLRDKVASFAQRFTPPRNGGQVSAPSAAPVDDSWHRAMVERANQGFRDLAARQAAARAVAARTPARTPSRTPAKAAKSRTSGRR